MSRMSDVMIEIQELAQRGMTAKFISIALGVPLSWAEEGVREVEQHEFLEQQYQMMMDGEYDEDIHSDRML